MQISQHQASAREAPHIWVLHSTGAGANRQLLNLAAALGATCEVKQTLDAPFRAFIDRILWPFDRRIPRRKQAQLRPPWPDLVLIGGGRSLVDALRIRASSGGHSRIVCLGRPAAPLDWLDQVITTPQYGLPEHENVVPIALPLNSPDLERLGRAAAAWAPRLAHYPRPWYGVLLGGDSGSYRYTPAAARALGRALHKLAAETSGTLLITTSPRTAAATLDSMLAELSCQYYLYRWKQNDADNPLEAIFALCDRFVVTADSASMLAEACSLGRPVASFEPPLRWPARLLRRSWLPPWPRRLRTRWAALRSKWIIKGWWIPARDMQRIHHDLRAQGRVCPLDQLNLQQAGSAAGQDDDLNRAVTAIQALLDPNQVTGS